MSLQPNGWSTTESCVAIFYKGLGITEKEKKQEEAQTDSLGILVMDTGTVLLRQKKTDYISFFSVYPSYSNRPLNQDPGFAFFSLAS